MNNGPDSWERLCTKCGASNLTAANTCWLCLQPLAPAPAMPESESASSERPREPAPGRWTFSLESVFLVITLIAVCLGALSQYPSLGIPMAIFALPALVRTTLVVQRRQGSRAVPAGTKISLFLGSFVVTAIICIVVCVTAVATFCGVACSILAVSGEGSFRDEASSSRAVALGGLAALVACIGLLILLVRWTRTRWRRDIRPDD